MEGGDRGMNCALLQIEQPGATSSSQALIDVDCQQRVNTISLYIIHFVHLGPIDQW